MTRRGIRIQLDRRPRQPRHAAREGHRSLLRPRTDTLLERRDQGDRRLGALVLVAPVRFEAVVAAAGAGVEHRRAGVVVAEEPGHRPGHPAGEALVAGQIEGAPAGIGQGGRFDGLLVEAGTGVVRPPASARAEGEMVPGRLGGQEPLQQPDALARQPIVVQPPARGHERLGPHGVGVRQSGLGPGPVRVMGAVGPPTRAQDGRASDVGGRPQQIEGSVMPGMAGEDLGGAEGGEGHRPGGGDPAPATGFEVGEGVGPQPGRRAPHRGGARGPQGPAPPVAQARLVGPAPVVAEPVVAPALGVLGMVHEGEIALAQRHEGGRRRRFPADDHQAPGHVVEAVAVLPARHRAPGVLEEPRVVAQPVQVLEGGLQPAHATAAVRASITAVARLR